MLACSERDGTSLTLYDERELIACSTGAEGRGRGAIRSWLSLVPLGTQIVTFKYISPRQESCPATRLHLSHAFNSFKTRRPESGMRWLSPLLPLLILCSTTWASTTNSTQYPLFPSSSPEANEPPLQLLHTSLSTLLPILPALSPPPSHTLLVTLATPAFKPLLFNWICFLRHKAHWGEGESPNQDDSPEEAEHRRRQLKGPAKDLIKLLVVTSDEQLARELTDEHGVVVWWLKGVDWDQEERRAKEAGDGKQEDDVSNQARIERILTDDLFTSLRSMDLLLPPHPPSKQQQGMLEWGSLHYQSLMLERTLVMTALTGALVESQKVEREDREREEAEWKARVLAHDWEESRLMREPFVGVKGVLLVDNDAVW